MGAVALAVPAPATAATVSESAGTLTYSTAAGESNHVTIAPWGIALKVTETGTKASHAIVLSSGPGCWKLSSSSAACSAAVSKLSADLGDGDDFFDASGTTIAATVLCGSGHDSGTSKPLDSLNLDCEFRPVDLAPPVSIPDPVAPDPVSATPVDLPTTDPSALQGPQPEPDQPSATTTPSVATSNATPPTIPSQTVGISASGVARVQVVCPADSGGCAGTVAIELPATGTAKATLAARRKPTRLGQARFTAKAGTAPIVPVRLSKRGRRRIMRGRHSRGRIRVTTRSANGRSVVTTQDVTFSPRAKRTRRRR